MPPLWRNALAATVTQITCGHQRPHYVDAGATRWWLRVDLTQCPAGRDRSAADSDGQGDPKAARVSRLTLQIALKKILH